MGERLRVLIVEDLKSDAELELRELARAGLRCDSRRVDTEPEFRGALAEFAPDLILSDFSMPHFDGMAALAIAREQAPHVPFIFVSGTLGEEYAIRAMRNGASDYVLKSNMARLPPVVERALGEARARAEKRRIEQALQESQARYQATFEQAAVGIVHSALDGSILMANRFFCGLTGRDRDEVLRLNLRDVTHPEDFARTTRDRNRLAAGNGGSYQHEVRMARQDGSHHWCGVTTSLVSGADGASPRFVSVVADIAERRRAEDELRRFRLALDNSPDIVVIVDRETMRHADVNETACRLLGYTREELLAMGPADTLPVTREEIEKTYDELIASGAPSSGMNSYYRCKDGTRLPFESTRRVLRSGDRWLVVAVSRDIRERLAAEKARREAEERFRSIFENSAEGIYQTSPEGRIIACNPAAARMFGFDSPAHAVAAVADLGSQAYADKGGRNRLMEALEARGVVHGFESRFARRDGSVMWASISARLMRDEDGGVSHVLGMIQDVTERKAQQQKIERLSRVHAMLSGINAAIVRVRDRDELFREACRVACAAGGFRMAWAGVVEHAAGRIRPVTWEGGDEEYIRSLPLDLDEVASGRPSLAGRAVLERKPVVADDLAVDERVVLRDEARKRNFHSLAILPLLDGDQAMGVLALYATEIGFFDAEEMALLAELAGDVSFALSAIAKDEKLNYLALYDPLTGLANRALMLERLGQSARAAGQLGAKLAIAWLDIERITTVNDSLGRKAGDALLQQAGERLARAAGASNVARIAADHFVAMLPNVKGRSEATRATAELVRACFGEAYLVDGAELRIAAKAGLSLFPNDATEAEALLGNAEAALKKAKESGERLVFYTPDLVERTGEALSLENKLRRALENDEFVLHYQPKVDLLSNAIIGAEALIRWESPELGLVPPGRFIPLMEETGMILEAGAWALRRAAADHRRWTEARLPAPRVAVNVSAIQLRQRDFVATLQAAIQDGMAPTGIDLEITESLVMEDVEGNIDKLRAVRALGMEIAIDDFGTGYSSLGYLAKLPVQTLKIDRSFIITMLKDPDTMTLVQTIISLAHSMRLKVVAEGVDDPEQAKLLRLLRCDQMQGYLFSKPLPFEQMTALLAPPAAAGGD